MKRIKQISIVVCAFAIGLSSCNRPKTETKVVAEVAVVKVQEVLEREVDQIDALTATVQPQVKNSIAPSAPGRIRDILVEVGQQVSKGQKLVQMDAASLSNLESQIDNLKRMYNRVNGLFSVGGASQQELDNAKLQLDLAQTNMKNISENTFLLSPITGIITARNYDNGDMYAGQMPVLTVMQINPVKLVVNVSESYYTQVKMGMPVDIKFDVFENEKFTGKVNLIYPTISEQTRTFAVEVKLANGNNKVRPGMFARVLFSFGKSRRVVVPDQSIVKQSGSGARFVYVFNNGNVEYKQVQLGRRMDTEYEILSGLKSGELVVVAGQSKLIDGGKAKLAK